MRLCQVKLHHQRETAENVWWLGFWWRIWSSGFRVSGLVCRVSGFRFRVSGFVLRVSGFGFRVSGFGFRVSSFGFGAGSFGFRVWGSQMGFYLEHYVTEKDAVVALRRLLDAWRVVQLLPPAPRKQALRKKGMDWKRLFIDSGLVGWLVD